MSEGHAEKSPCSFQQTSDTFLKWFTSQKDTRLNPKVKIADLRSRGAGRGVVAVSDIDEDEELFAIPRSLVLDRKNSDLEQRLAEKGEMDFHAWFEATVVVIYEYLRKDVSPWFPYLSVLPTTFDTLMFWSAAELAELQGSIVVHKIGKEAAEGDWMHTIIPLMLKYPSLFGVTGDTTSNVTVYRREVARLIRLAHMAASLVMAYAFDIEEDDEADYGYDCSAEHDIHDPDKGLVPFADLLNADADANNARLFYEEDFLVMKAIKAIRAGDEIFNDYGSLPRSDLLRRYGYVTDNYARHDVVELGPEMIEEVERSCGGSRSKKVEEAMESYKKLYLYDDYAITRPTPDMTLVDAIPVELHMLISALSRDSEFAADYRASKYSGSDHGWGFAEASLLSVVVTKRLTEYPTTVTEDAELLSQLKDGATDRVPAGVSQHRYEMAIQVRRGEKDILHELLRLIQKVVAAKTNEVSTAQLKKKRKGKAIILSEQSKKLRQ